METERRLYVKNDLDISLVRIQAREMAKQIGFGTADQARISLAASELARALSSSPGRQGEIIIAPAAKNGQRGMQLACLIDLGQGAGRGRSDESTVGQNRSISGARQLVDEDLFEPQDNTFTRVRLMKWLK